MKGTVGQNQHKRDVIFRAPSILRANYWKSRRPRARDNYAILKFLTNPLRKRGPQKLSVTGLYGAAQW